MNCVDCGVLIETEAESSRCAECARENAMYAAYSAGIDAPAMWDALEQRIEHEHHRERWRSRIAFAAVAAVALFVIGTLVFERRMTQPIASTGSAPAVSQPAPVSLAVAHYRAAISTLERKSGTAVPLTSELSVAIAEAERTARVNPDDPVAVTRLVDAYDAKLQVLRATVYD